MMTDDSGRMTLNLTRRALLATAASTLVATPAWAATFEEWRESFRAVPWRAVFQMPSIAV